MRSRAGRPARLSWARLLKRVFDIDIEHCPNCGGSLKIIACPEPRRRAAIEDPPVIIKILSPSGPTDPRPAPCPSAPSRSIPDNLRSPKTACQRKPTAPLALSSSERRHKGPFAHLPTALRPSRLVQQWVFYQAEKELTSLAVLRYDSSHRKRWFKNPIHLDCSWVLFSVASPSAQLPTPPATPAEDPSEHHEITPSCRAEVTQLCRGASCPVAVESKSVWKPMRLSSRPRAVRPFKSDWTKTAQKENSRAAEVEPFRHEEDMP